MVIVDPEINNKVMNKEININKENKNLFGATKHPDPKAHQIVSFLKSAVRITGYAFLPVDIFTAACILIISELIGIAEELV